MYSKLLVPLDGSTLAEKAVSHAGMLAKIAGSEIILVRAVVNPLTRLPESGIPDEAAFLESLLEEARRYLSAVADGLIAEGLHARTVVREGEPEDIIIDVAQDEDVDMIVMGTHGRSGISLLVMGSVAMKVIHATSRPVLLIKPDRG